MNLLAQYRQWRANRERRRAFRSIRGHLAFFGFDTSQMTDEEIEQAVVNLGRVAATAGVSAEQAVRAFRALGEAGK